MVAEESDSIHDSSHGDIEADVADVLLNPGTTSAIPTGVPTSPQRYEPPGGGLHPVWVGHLGPPVGSCAKSASTGEWTVEPADGPALGRPGRPYLVASSTSRPMIIIPTHSYGLQGIGVFVKVSA